MSVDFTYTQQEVDALCKVYFEKGKKHSLISIRKIIHMGCWEDDCYRCDFQKHDIDSCGQDYIIKKIKDYINAELKDRNDS